MANNDFKHYHIFKKQGMYFKNVGDFNLKISGGKLELTDFDWFSKESLSFDLIDSIERDYGKHWADGTCFFCGAKVNKHDTGCNKCHKSFCN